MAKIQIPEFIKNIPAILGFILCLTGLVIYPLETAAGIRKGLVLLAENVIPTLFPFMVFSSFVSKTSFSEMISRVLDKAAQKIFKTSGTGLVAVILGLLGGYPIGAKMVSDFYSQGKLTKSEAQKLFCWCINPSPAFVISAVGIFMISSFQSGVILYASTVLSALSLGFFTRFFENRETSTINNTVLPKQSNPFVNSVSSASEAMLAICGWVLTFSAIAALTDIFIPNEHWALFIKSTLEVTTGCKAAAEYKLQLPIISAILGFGGFAVIFQINSYMRDCSVSMKHFLCIKVLNAALNAFFCSLLLNIFPETVNASVTLSVGNINIPFSHSLVTGIILVMMCIVFIFEVDNKKKVC